MKIALDTNRYVDFARGDMSVTETLEGAEELLMPLPVLGELRAGFAVGSRGAQNEGALRRFLLKPGVALLSPDEQTTHHYAMVFRQLRQQGTPIQRMICGSRHWYCSTVSCSARGMPTSITSRKLRVCDPL